MQPHLLASNENDVIIIAIVVGCGMIIAVIATIATALQKVLQTRQREMTRREIAAYVAEGSISPDDAAKILSSGGKLKDKLAEKFNG